MHLFIYLFIYLSIYLSSVEHMFTDFRKRKGERERERNIDCLVASCMYPDWETNPQSRRVPWWGIKPSTFWCRDDTATNWPTWPGLFYFILIDDLCIWFPLLPMNIWSQNFLTNYLTTLTIHFWCAYIHSYISNVLPGSKSACLPNPNYFTRQHPGLISTCLNSSNNLVVPQKFIIVSCL